MSPPNKRRPSASSKSGEVQNPMLQNFNPEMIGSLGEVGSAYLRGVVTLNQEVNEFINKRLEHDAELTRALGKCKDWTEAAELQQNWFREASEEYAANAKKLMEMTTQLMNETWAPLQHQQQKETDTAES